MKLRFRVIVILAAFAMAAVTGLAAQEAGEKATPPAAKASESAFSRGDQTLSLSTGFQIPLFIVPDPTPTPGAKLLMGGSFSFSYQYFLDSHIAIGGTLNGAFNGTIGGRNLFVAPLSFRSAYWWTIGPVEACAAVEAGGYLMRLDGNSMLGPFAKLGGAATWRLSQSWSVGAQVYYWVVPEIHTGAFSSQTRVGNFLETALTAVYHL